MGNEHWVETTLGDIAEVIGGGTPSTSHGEYWNGDIPWITPKDLTKYTDIFIGKGERKITQNGLVNSSARILPTGTVLLTTRAPIGYLAIAANELCTNQGFKSFILNKKMANNLYVYYWLKYNKENLQGMGTGTTFLEISGKVAKDIPIILPPLNEQKRIVEKLDAILPKVKQAKERLENVSAILKKFRQSVLATACSGKLTAEWREGKDFKLFGKMLIESIQNDRLKEHEMKCKQCELSNIRKPKKPVLSVNGDIDIFIDLPMTWSACHIGDIGEVSNGSTPSRKIKKYWGGSIPWINSGLIQNNRIIEVKEHISDQGYENSSVKILPKGTVLIAMIGEGKTRGQSSILDIDATINQNISGIEISHKKVIPEYLQMWFIMNYDKNREIGSGTGPRALNCDRVRELPFILPPTEEQQEIVCRVEQLFAVVDSLEEKYQSAMSRVNKIEQAVLAKAFRGELAEADPDDESAEELLKRILGEKEWHAILPVI
ncbi:type I restriction endonuclease MjaXP subunit S [Spirochaetia bacterium]|nr:type I restriction endonuclease MjaXP subunit S [Spirochaetia bacterium]